MKQLKRFTKAASIISAISLIVACGGGDQLGTVSKADSGYSVSGGVAQKGPLLRGSTVKIDQLDENTFSAKTSVANIATNDDTGAFDSSYAIISSKIIQTSAEGYFFDELTGKTTKDTVKIEGKSDLSMDRLINVNLLTTLSSKRIDALFLNKTNKLTYHNFKASRNQAQKEVLAAFRIYNAEDLLPGGLDKSGKIVPASFNELDLSNVQTGSQILAAISAVAVKVGTNEAGIRKFIADFQSDISDDGQINGSVPHTSIRNSIDVASAAVDMTAVANNLNSFYHITTYTADMLKQWIDSSGGVDQVIDKYKSSVKDVAVSTEIKSSEYLAGPDDVGQCFSSSKGNLYRNGLLVSGLGKAAVGDKFAIGLTESGSQINRIGFIQRGAPNASVCDATVSGKTATRIYKFDITTVLATTTYDLDKQFSDKVNPNGVWTYGEIDSWSGTGFVPFSIQYSMNATTGWIGNNSASGVPMLLHNWFNSQYCLPYFPGICIPPNETIIHPGFGNRITTVRFTAPTTGSYAVNAAFWTADAGTGTSPNLTGTNIGMILNGILQGVTQALTTPDQMVLHPKTIIKNITLNAGDVMDFAVSNNYGNASNDSTGVRISIVGPAN